MFGTNGGGGGHKGYGAGGMSGILNMNESMSVEFENLARLKSSILKA